jgi:hypothetical protein
MKQMVLVGVLALTGAVSIAQAQAHNSKAATEGRSAPRPQSATALPPPAPPEEIALGSVHLTRAVKADGKPLPAGTYQVRLTAQNANPPAPGESQGLERWVEFVQGGQVKGREVATIVPQSEIAQVERDTPPAPNAVKVELLKGGEYVRIWTRRGNYHYLLHLVAG